MTAPTEIAYLRHIRDALGAVLEYTAGGRDTSTWSGASSRTKCRRCSLS